MIKSWNPVLLSGLAVALAVTPVLAEEAKTNSPPSKAEAKAKEETKPSPATIPDAATKPVISTNTVTIAGEAVTYTVETGMLPLLKNDGVTRASVFYIAYTREGQTNKAMRPVTFCFNGGPGSSSVWLHPVSYTHLRAHETGRNLVCRLLLEKKKKKKK